MSLNSSEYLNQSRKKLVTALGDKKDTYFSYMKQWFRMKITKEEFDSSARLLLPVELVHLHNEFLLAILTKCQLFNSSNSCTAMPIKNEPTRIEEPYIEKPRTEPQTINIKMPIYNTLQHNLINVNLISNDRKKLKPKKKMKIISPVIENNFEPVNLQDIAPTSNLREPASITEANAGYHSRSLHLLDTGPIKGRLLLAAWDHGLTSVSEYVSLLLQEASKQCLKNVLTAVISRRKGFRVREGKFVHSVGTLPSNPWLRNSAALNDWTSESLGLPFGEGIDGSYHRPTWPTVDAAEQNAAQLASCAPPHDPLLPPLSAFDLFATLQVHKSILPCHTVYSLNMERISSRLWHPGWAELEQEAIAAKEASVREILREQRLAATPINSASSS